MYTRYLVLPVKLTLVAVGAEEEAGDPGRGAAHHIADRAEVSLRRALDDKLVMHRADDEAVAECPHGIGQDIAGDGLDNILGDLGTVGLEPGPLAEVRALVGHAVRAESNQFTAFCPPPLGEGGTARER